jgi:acetyltransferase-like isoleucine patch superfamily enzyme
MIAMTPLPSRVKVAIYRNLFGFDVATDAYIGYSVIVCRNLAMGSGAFIGHLNVIRGDMTLQMKPRSHIGQMNWITGGTSDPRYFKGSGRCPELVLGEESSITSRHVLDCTDRIELGRFSTIAGYRGSIITHGIDYREATQNCRPIKIGDFCLIGSNVIILMGVTIADRSIVGAGSVVVGSIEEELGVWVGAPARRVRDLSGEERFFARQGGFVY